MLRNKFCPGLPPRLARWSGLLGDVGLAADRSMEEVPAEFAFKHQSKGEHLGRYTNPFRQKHFRALRRLDKKLSAVFSAAGETPWVRPSKNYMGRAKAEKVRVFRRQGVPPKAIAAELDVSVASLHRLAPASGRPRTV